MVYFPELFIETIFPIDCDADSKGSPAILHHCYRVVVDNFDLNQGGAEGRVQLYFDHIDVLL